MAESEKITLPGPDTKGKIYLEEAIAKRRSIRSFSDKELSLEQISQLLWAAQGITAKKGDFSYRAAPSAGALYPMEVYLVKKDGLYRYLPERHALEALNKKDLRQNLASSAFGQACISQAPVSIVICAVYSRITVKYRDRGIRYAHIEAGHIAQNIHLEAVALGLGSVPVGAFNDDDTKRVLTLPINNEPLYIIPVGFAQ